MKFVQTAMASMAAAAMLAAPIAASAAPAAKLSVSQAIKGARATSPVSKKSALEGGSTIIAIIAVAAVVGGIALAAGGNSKPKSP